MKKAAIFILFCLLLASANAAEIKVPEDFNRIQDAINAANDGDTIIVKGYCKENIVVNKVIRLVGLNAVIDGEKRGDVIRVEANNVKISGFQIKNSSSRGAGIYIKSNNNEIFDVEVTDNYFGIKIERGKENVIRNNKIKDNRFGLYLWLTKNNKIYLNEFDNLINVFSIGSENIWNTTLTEYFYNGKFFRGYLGNYFDDYIGHDLNNDGVGDIPYVMGLDRDSHPLMKIPRTYFAQSGDEQSNNQIQNKPPVADFNAPESVYVNEVVNFNAIAYDPDGNISKYAWNIDGKTFYGKEISYTFNDPGLYAVKLTVYDDKNASSSVTKSIRVLINSKNAAIMIVAPKVVTGKTLEISVVARNVSNLGAFMMKINFNPDVVERSPVTRKGSDLPEAGYFGTLKGNDFVRIVFLSNNGTINNGELAKLTFRVKDKGIAKFSIKGIAATPDFDPIKVEWIGAEVNVE